jgi:hypothetical protein
MTSPDLLGRGLYFGLLLLGAAALLAQPMRTAPPGAVFTVLALFAHGAARLLGVRGAGKALLFLGAWPFFSLGAVRLGRLEPAEALLVAGAGAAAGAALVAGEWLLVKRTATFTTSLLFFGASCLAGVGLTLLPVPVFRGLALLALTLAGYGLARGGGG